MNLNVPASLHDAFKAVTAAEGKKMSEVLLAYIEQYVEKNEKYLLPRGRKARR